MRITFPKIFSSKIKNPEKTQADSRKPVVISSDKNNVTSAPIDAVSSSVLASVTYKKKLTREEVSDIVKHLIKQNSMLKTYIDKDFLEKFDYENAQEHIDNLKFLVQNDSDFAYSNVFTNGYFYSKQGLDAFNIIKSKFSADSSKRRSMIDIACGEFTVSDVLQAEKKHLFDKFNNDSYSDIFFIKEVLKLSQEEYERLETTGLLDKKITYASKHEPINKTFEVYSSVNNGIVWSTDKFKFLEECIINASNGSDEKLQSIANKLCNIKNKKFVSELLDNKENSSIDIEFIANNLDEIHSLVHKKIEDYEDSPFFGGFLTLLKLLNKDNIEVFNELINLDGIDQDLLEKTLQYAYSKENCDYIKQIISDINSGEKELIDLPAFKHAKLNKRIDSQRNSTIQEFDADTSIDEAKRETKEGEIYTIGEDVYINHNGEPQKIKLDKTTYQKLFPPFKSLCIQQGRGTGDCYFLTGGLISFWKNDNARAYLLNMFEMDGNDIIVTFPKFENYPVRFKNGEIKLGDKHAQTSLGNLMLEQAYSKAKYAYKNKLANTDDVDADKAMDFIYGGRECDVFDEITGLNKSKQYVDKSYKQFLNGEKNAEYVTHEQMYKLLDKYSTDDKSLLCASTKAQDEGMKIGYGVTSKHAYAIENIDKENRTVTLINPYNSLYTTTLSYEDFAVHFLTLSVIEL